MSGANEPGEMTPPPERSVSGQAEGTVHSQGRRERYLEKLIEGGSDVFLVLDREGTVRFRSSGGKHLAGWHDDELVAQSLAGFLAPDCMAVAQEALGEMLSNPDRAVRTELRVRHKDGSYLDMEVRGRNLLDDPDVEGVVIAALDITDRKRTEAALRESEARYRRLFEAAQDGVLLLDPGTAEIFDVNPFLCDLLGASREQIVGKKIWQIGPFRDVPASKVNFRHLQESQFIRYEDLPLETTMVARSLWSSSATSIRWATRT